LNDSCSATLRTVAAVTVATINLTYDNAEDGFEKHYVVFNEL